MLRLFSLRLFGGSPSGVSLVPPDAAVVGTDCAPGCSLDCPLVFERLVVSYSNRQGASIYWSLLPEFVEPTPHYFQLQRSDDPAPDADWTNVGGQLLNAVSASDDGVLPFHRAKPPHYRVRLQTPSGVHYSPVTAQWGTLSKKGWRQAQEAYAQENWHHKNSPGSSLGWLVKARTVGDDCPRCYDRETKQARDPACLVCYGTGKQCGYYSPLGCVWADLSTKTARGERDPKRGPVHSSTRRARMTLLPLVEEGDFWVHGKNGDRYFVDQIEALVEVEDVTVAASVTLRLANASDIVYAIPVPPVE
jgi:hypothetical protein